MLENLRVAGLLYCKKTIWGYSIEVWIGDKLCVRTENGVYHDESTTPEWRFPGSWIIPGAPASTAVNHKFCLEIASYNEWVCSRCFGVMALLYLFVVRGDRMGRAKESKREQIKQGAAQETILTPLELHPKLREGAETEVPR